MPELTQADLDRRNADFWDELCGTTLARWVGVTDASPESLAKFDRAYLDMYPYLERHLHDVRLGERVLEIGLGYGTLGQMIASRGADYHGLDIAPGPVAMMRQRLERLEIAEADARVQVGSALEIPHPDRSFSAVVTIGCLHHTGDVPLAIREVRRVLEPGGTAVVMLYNRNSMRRKVLAVRGLLRDKSDEEAVRALYDANSSGKAAPAIEFVSRRQAKRLFDTFATVRVRSENFDEIALLRGRIRVPRSRLLGLPARLAGLDLYVTAIR